MKNSKKWPPVLLALVTAFMAILPISTSLAADHVLTVDLSSNTGAIKYGASGFLYGLGDDGIPTDAVLFPISPRVAAQKPQNGAQHPNGNAFDIAPQFFAAGGDNIEIYMQDIYSDWPYQNLGIADYLTKVESIANAVVSNQYRSRYVYVPFNEPDQIWYAGNINGLCNDWKTVFNKIRSIDPTAKIAGPNYAGYNSSHYNTFMEFCKNNNCLPDIVTWHELGDAFFSGWYTRLNDYRSIEARLGISARHICINEYGRFSGDLGYPGNMVQWMARFENSKVDACRAYWGAAGNLDELVVENNKVNGANAEMIGDHSYNTNVVDRTADITVNGTVQHSGLHFRNTYLWNNYSTTVVDITLNAGNNTIKFSNSSAYAPNIDKISIAAAEATDTGGGSGIVSGETYKLINRNSGKSLDVNGGSTADGADVIRWTYHGGNNQHWQIVSP